MRKGIKTYNPLSLSNGFTLLEILVALAILATAVTIIFQLFSASLRNISVSEDVVAASVRAEAKMREVLSREELSADSWTEDTNDGYKFTVNITETLQQKLTVCHYSYYRLILQYHGLRTQRNAPFT